MHAIVLLPLLSLLLDTFRGRAVLQLELLALRHQLATMKRISPRPSPRPSDRLFWVLLSRLLPNWRDVLVIVKPETVIGWHRKSFRFFGPGSHDDREAGARQHPARPVILYQRSLVMPHRDGFPHALRLGFSARSAWRGDAGHREPCGTLSESPSLEAWGKPPPVAWANRRGRREALTMPRIARGSPPARRIARAISMGHYQCSLV